MLLNAIDFDLVHGLQADKHVQEGSHVLKLALGPPHERVVAIAIETSLSPSPLIVLCEKPLFLEVHDLPNEFLVEIEKLKQLLGQEVDLRSLGKGSLCIDLGGWLV